MIGMVHDIYDIYIYEAKHPEANTRCDDSTRRLALQQGEEQRQQLVSVISMLKQVCTACKLFMQALSCTLSEDGVSVCRVYLAKPRVSFANLLRSYALQVTLLSHVSAFQLCLASHLLWMHMASNLPKPHQSGCFLELSF
eukprot:461523-Pelagomonas_calceolata.AAC.5